MAKIFILVTIVFLSVCMNHDNPVFPESAKGTAISKLKEGDSIVIYQCKVVPVKEQLITIENGSQVKLKSENQFISLTDKIKINRVNNNYLLKHYSSPTTYYPNKKFAYLKLTEKDYWEFKMDLDTVLPFKDVLIIAAYEKKCLPLNEYDLKVVDNNSPQLILNGHKISEQYRIKQKIVLTDLISVFKNGKK